MRAANRKSWLPQPSRLPAPTAVDESLPRRVPEEDDDVQHSTTTGDRSDAQPDDKPSRRGTIVKRNNDAAIGSKLDKATASTLSHGRHESIAQESIVPTRSLSTRSTTGHSKTSSSGSNGKSSSSHRPVTSRDLKPPARVSRPARSGTLSGNTTAAQSRFGARPASVHAESRSNTVAQSHAHAVRSSQVKASGPAAGSRPPEDSNVQQSPSHAQVELYQLSVYHEQACEALRLWEASALRTLGDRHSQLREMLREVVVLEHQRAKEANLDALSRWLPDATDLLARLQTLSGIHQEAVGLTADGSEYTATMSSFSRWVLEAEECLSDAGALSISRLPEEWRHSHASTALKVRSLQRELALLPVPSKSSLAELMKGCGSLLDATLRELDLMSKLETLLCERDKSRVERAIQSYSMQSQLLQPPQPPPRLAWKTLA